MISSTAAKLDVQLCADPVGPYRDENNCDCCRLDVEGGAYLT